MNNTSLLFLLFSLTPLVAVAQAASQPVTVTGASTSAPVIGLVEADVLKVDQRTNKVTLRHGGVPHLGVKAGVSTWLVRDGQAIDVAKPGDRVRFRAERVRGAVVLTELAAIAKPSPELIEIQWDVAGQFAQSVTVAPWAFVEVCGKLAKDQKIEWSFSGPAPMEFNIHYHVGSSVSYPARQSGVAALTGTLVVPVDQDYCWMWENRSAQTVTLALSLAKTD
jgi:Cu/Ag efflux protein CusF